MQTRLDLMAQCVDALSWALHCGNSRGHFISLGDGRLELQYPLGEATAVADAAKIVHGVTVRLFRAHRVEVDDFEQLEPGQPLEFTVTNEVGETTRLPLRFTCLCSETSRMAPVLSIVIGGY